ncbi:MAG: hypothetical protein ACKO7W_24900 [Elainella sp.]
MADEFVFDPSGFDPSADETAQRERIKHVLYGSPRAIARTIHQLHNQGYAEAPA